jgi:4-amino-4-deoxy-L-arabinose transferase-like glycosyltransferase
LRLPQPLEVPSVARDYWKFIGAATLLYAVLFWRLGVPTFWDPDEAHYAQTSHELIATGDWTAPFYNELPFFDKPILFHWLQALPMILIADPESGARFSPALAGAILVWITWWLGVQLAGRRVGAVAALLLSVNPGLFGLARYAILDTVFTAFLFGGLSLLAVAALGGRPRLQYGGYVLVGLAAFTKGPLALVLSGLVFGAALATSADLRPRLLSLRWGRGAVIAASLPLPWLVYMLWRFGGAFGRGYVLDENLLLFATPLYANQPPWWFYLGIIGTGFLPWTPLIIGRLVDQLRGSKPSGRSIDPFEHLLWLWSLTVIGFFSLSRFKLDHYVFPAAPALCLICARAWAEAGSPAAGPGVRAGVRLIGPTLMAAGIGVGIFMVSRLNLPAAALSVAAVLTAAGIWAAVKYRGAGIGGAPLAAIAALGFTYAGLVLWVMPAIERGKVIPDVAAWVASRASPDDRIATFRLNRWNPAYRFYVNRHTEVLESDEQARRFFADPQPYYCVMTRPLYEALRAAGVPIEIAYRRDGLWVTSGKALWKEQPETTEFIVATGGAPRTAP